MQNKSELFTAQHSTAQHSTAQHSTAQHSTAQHRLTALFLRPAAARRMELNTVFVMDNRRILTGIRHKGYRKAVDSL